MLCITNLHVVRYWCSITVVEYYQKNNQNKRMKNIVFSLITTAILAVPLVSFAAMPNFNGTGYKQPTQCVLGSDHGIWEIVDGVVTLTGCTPDADFQRSKADAEKLQSTGFHFGVGQSVALKVGAPAFCPVWFIPYAGCVVGTDLVR